MHGKPKATGGGRAGDLVESCCEHRSLPRRPSCLRGETARGVAASPSLSGVQPVRPSPCHYALHASVASHSRECTEGPGDPRAHLPWANLSVRHGVLHSQGDIPVAVASTATSHCERGEEGLSPLRLCCPQNGGGSLSTACSPTLRRTTSSREDEAAEGREGLTSKRYRSGRFCRKTSNVGEGEGGRLPTGPRAAPTVRAPRSRLLSPSNSPVRLLTTPPSRKL